MFGHVIVFSVISGVIAYTVDVGSRVLAGVLVGNLGSFVLRRVVLVRVCITTRLRRAAITISTDFYSFLLSEMKSSSVSFFGWRLILT